MDVRVLDTAGELATTAFVLLLVDVGGATAGVGSDAEGEGKESDNGNKLHFGALFG